MRAALSLLLAVLLVGGGVSAAALAANTDQWESARTFLALKPGWADAALLTALTTAVESLGDGLAGGLAPGVPVIDIAAEAGSTEGAAAWVARLAAMTAEAADAASSIEGLTAAVHTAIGDVARAAVKGAGSIARMDLATEAQRDAALSALELVADQVRSQQDALESLISYTASWKAVNDAQVAAKAAAEAAAQAEAEAEASRGSSGGRTSSRPPLLLFGDNPPIVTALGDQRDDCEMLGLVDEFYAVGGETVVVNYPFPYMLWFDYAPATNWHFTVYQCA